MQVPVIAIQLLTDLLFFSLCVISLYRWRKTRSGADRWLATTFLTIAWIIMISLLWNQNPRNDFESWMHSHVLQPSGLIESVIERISALALVLFPYFLFRFVTSFRPASRIATTLAVLLTGVMAIAILTLPKFPDEGDKPTTYILLLTFTLLAQWGYLFSYVGYRFWRNSLDQPGVVRKRMALLGFGALALVAMIIVGGVVTAATGNTNEPSNTMLIVNGLFGFGSALLFLIGYAPPRFLRVSWHLPEQETARRIILECMRSADVKSMMAAVLPMVSSISGGQGSAIYDNDGNLVGSYGVSAEELNRRELGEPPASHFRLLDFDMPRGKLVVWATQYVAFFGDAEVELLKTMSVVLDLAIERLQLLERERDTTEQMRAVNDLKSEFVAMVAHDLRSPMAVITGFAETMLNRWDGIEDDDKKEFLTMILRSASSLSLLVEDVLQVARIDLGEFKYSMSQFDVAVTIKRTIAELSTTTKADRFKLDIPDSLPPAWGDEERNWQVLTNLISNALKFSPLEEPVEIAVRPNGTHLKICVTDHGIGIDPIEHRKIFEKFCRIEPSDGMQRSKGTGLGLYICKSMIEAQGGTIWVESAPQVGSSFTYTVPISR